MLSPSVGHPRTESTVRALAVLISFAMVGATASIAAAQGTSNLVGWGANQPGSVPSDLGYCSSAASGASHTIALKADGSVVCWGTNVYGECNVPTGLGSCTEVAAINSHNAALTSDGSVVCWGSNSAGQSTVPAGLGVVAQVATGHEHTVALKSAGTVSCWGYNLYGQCTVPGGLASVSRIAADGYHTMALGSSGAVTCWGRNTSGQCTLPSGLGLCSEIEAGWGHSVALKTGGVVACWGLNDAGQCNVPADLGACIQVAAGSSHTVALRSDRTVRCWGSNTFGQCTLPSGVGVCTRVFAGPQNTLALKAPTLIRVPEDAASINAAAVMVVEGTAAEIVVAAGTWPASIATAAGTEVTVRGAGVGLTTIVPTSVGGTLVANPQIPNTNRVHFSHSTLQGGGGDHWRTTLDHCRVETHTGNFFPEGRTISDTAFVSCAPVSWCTIYQQPQAIIERCTFLNCNRPILIWRGNGVQGSFVRDCDFTTCTSSCVWIKHESAPTDSDRAVVERCSFTNTNGRAIYYECSQQSAAQAPLFSVIDSQFTGNTLTSGNGAAIHIGGLSTNYTTSSSNTTVTGCTFTNNSATSGGAIEARPYQPLTATNCTFSGNSAISTGGAINGGWATSGSGHGTISLSDCLFSDNVANSGGALHFAQRSATIVRGTFVGNGAGVGSCYTGAKSTTTFTDSLFDAHSGPGVAIYIAEGPGSNHVVGCVFKGNLADPGYPAAISVTSGQPGVYVGLSVERSHFESQRSPAIVGGYNYPSQFIPPQPNTSLSHNSFCECVAPLFYGGVTEGVGNCVTESCSDNDGDSIPDDCDSVTVPGDYATIQRAIDATVIGDFRIVNLGAGTFAGPISFNGKSIVVRGVGAGKTVIDGTGSASGSVVLFTGGEPATAALEGVTVRGGQGGTPLPANPAALVGGGVFGVNSAASIRNCVIEQNASGFGGGVYMFGCSGTIEQCVIRDNIAQADGGGLQLYGGAMSVLDCSITDNYANSRGGGVHAVLGAHEFTRVSITSNASNNLVGGLSWVPDGDPAAYLTLDDCTVTSNTAQKLYGGIGVVNDNGGPKLHLIATQVCLNTPAPNIAGAYTADMASEICDCVADVIPDGLVNGVDLAALLTAWGTDGGTTPRADCSRDGVVNGADLGMLLSAWGACAP